jgi:hypothetical protein
VYIAGTTNSPTITFGSTTFTTSSSQAGSFVTKLDAAGNVSWARKYGATDTAEAQFQRIALSSGAPVVVGIFQGVVNFDGTTLTSNAARPTRTDRPMPS